MFFLFANEVQRENRSQHIADGLCEEDAVYIPKRREDIQKWDKKNYLPQYCYDNRRSRTVDRLEECRCQHDKPQYRRDAEVDTQAGNTDLEHFFRPAKRRQDLSGEKQHRKPDDTGDGNRK